MEKKGKVEGEREGALLFRNMQLWVGGESRLLMNSVQVCLFGRFFLFLLWEPAWKLNSSGPNSHSTFKRVLSLDFSLKYASIFYLSFSFSFLMSSSERVMGTRAAHPLINTHRLSAIPTTISSPLLCVCRARLCFCYHSGIQQWYASCQNAYQTCRAHHFVPKTKGLLVREETEPWSKSLSIASEYSKAHYAVRLSVLLAFTGLLTVYIDRHLFTRWTFGGPKLSPWEARTKYPVSVNRNIKCN